MNLFEVLFRVSLTAMLLASMEITANERVRKASATANPSHRSSHDREPSMAEIFAGTLIIKDK